MSLINNQEFKPTAAMKLYAYQRGKLGDLVTELAISQKIRVAPETVSRWKKINGFSEWLEDQIAQYRAPILDVLEQVALDRLDDFRYWDAMANKYGFMSKDQNGEIRTIQLKYSLCDCEKMPNNLTN